MSGAHYLKDNRATQNAPSIACLRAAGVILTGKANVPMMTADWQTYNSLYGATRSLRDKQRSPGESPGGAAVAVAADFIPVEFGSDLSGSLHIPAHYTGVYAHHCSLGSMSVKGHTPGGGPQAADEPDLSVADPMARSAMDLRLMVRALSTFQVEPPRIPDLNRYQARANYRVCTWFSVPYRETDQQIVQRFQSFIDRLRVQPDVEVNDAMPANIDPSVLFDIAVKLSSRLVSTALSGRQCLTAGLATLGFRLVGKLANVPKGITSYYQGMLKDSDEQQNADKLRHEYSRVIEAFLTCYDVLLTPISPVLTFTHMRQPVCKRKLIVNDEPQDYNEHLFWNILATISGLPAAVYPLTKTMDGLPCGMQIISGHFHDDVMISLVEFCESISGGFMVPEGYQRWMSVITPIEVRRI